MDQILQLRSCCDLKITGWSGGMQHSWGCWPGPVHARFEVNVAFRLLPLGVGEKCVEQLSLFMLEIFSAPHVLQQLLAVQYMLVVNEEWDLWIFPYISCQGNHISRDVDDVWKHVLRVGVFVKDFEARIDPTEDSYVQDVRSGAIGCVCDILSWNDGTT